MGRIRAAERCGRVGGGIQLPSLGLALANSPYTADPNHLAGLRPESRGAHTLHGCLPANANASLPVTLLGSAALQEWGWENALGLSRPLQLWRGGESVGCSW